MLDFSIVIPAFNEEAYIGKCLESVQSLDYPKNKFSVNIIDNGSTDMTAAIAANFSDFYVYKKIGGLVGSVRNFGASFSSTSKYIAFLDSDCVVPRSWLIDASTILKDESVGAVGGGYLAPKDGTWVETSWAIEQYIPAIESKALPGGCFIVRRSLFEDLGGFNEQMGAGEDDELTRRIITQGHKVLCLRNLAVIHLGYPKQLRDIIKRQIWHGSSQLYSAEHYLDPLLLLTHVVLFSAILSVILALLGAFLSAVLIAVSGLMVPSLIAFYKKASRVGLIRLGIKKSIQMIILYIAFFLGRSYGLLRNYIHFFTKNNRIIGRD